MCFVIGIRRDGYKFFTLLHYPNQLLLSLPTMKYEWPIRQNNSTFAMRFRIDSMEVLTRRNKLNHPCKTDWKSYDDVVIHDHVKSTNCRTPYQKPIKGIPICNTKEKMQEADFSLTSGKINNQILPCRTAEKISYTFEEVDSTGKQWQGVGEFWSGIYFYNSRFKEITQSR